MAASGTPPSASDADAASPARSVPLADFLGTVRALTTFSSLARLHASTSAPLADLGAATTVLAPLNSAIDALPRKPWEEAADYAALGDAAYDGDAGRDRADRNLRRFVDAHLVPVSPWPRGQRAKSRAGREVWWDEGADGKRRIMPDDVEVERVASRVANGEVWILKGVLSAG